MNMRTEILRYLEKNSRVDLGELAVLLGTDEATIANEIADMEKEKIEVRVTPQRDLGFDRIAERIYNFPEVTAVYLISGAYDFLIILEGKTLKEVSRFVSEKLSPIEPVLSTATHFILKKYKDHGTILAPQKKAERMLVMP